VAKMFHSPAIDLTINQIPAERETSLVGMNAERPVPQ